MRKVGGTLLGLGLILLAGCGREQRRAEPALRPPYQAPQSVAPGALSPAVYVSSASSIDLFEIRSSELALQRSNSRRVRDFATTMVEAHKGSGAQLSLAGRRLNLLPSARLSAKHQAMLDQLQSAPDFDAAYRAQQQAVHQEALTIHRTYAARGTSPTLRPVAQAMVPIVERHIRLLRYL